MGRFYSQCFGLQQVSSGEGYCVLESDLWSVSLVSAQEEIAAAIQIGTPPTRRTNASVKLAFEVLSLEDTREVAASLGGQIDPATTQWSHLGVIHCDGIDPEGNVIQLVSPIVRVVEADGWQDAE
jgi:predicted enzyme related to lactoylglutathione lyase